MRKRISMLLPLAAAVLTAAAFAQESEQADDAGARYARAVADAESLTRFNAQLEGQVRS